MKIWMRLGFVGLLSLGFGCGHTINFRAAHFVTPVTGENSGDGHIAGVAHAITQVTLVNDFTTNPPDRTSVKINDSEDFDFMDILPLGNIGYDLSVATFKGLDVVLENNVVSLKYQLINQGAQPNSWVASIQAGLGQRTSNSKDDTAEARSIIKTNVRAISIGYTFEKLVPYVSYYQETHDVETNVTNSNGEFGPYSDRGAHSAIAVGVSAYRGRWIMAGEYNRINIKWDRSEATPQDAAGFKLGFAW